MYRMASTFDMSERIEAQIERFCPGFASRIRARSLMNTAAMEAENANYVGGDIAGGVRNPFSLFCKSASICYTDEGYLCLFLRRCRGKRGYMGCAVITRLKKSDEGDGVNFFGIDDFHPHLYTHLLRKGLKFPLTLILSLKGEETNRWVSS